MTSGARRRGLPALPRRVTNLVVTRGRTAIPLMALSERTEALFQRKTLARLADAENFEVARLADCRPSTSALISVVIPTYKRPDLLRRAVDSVLGQELADVQIVVIDDGGGQLGELPSDDRVTKLSLSRNYGVLALSRNVGIRLGRSRFVAFLDDDNEWLPHHLRSALAPLLNTAADIVYTSRTMVDPDGHVVRTEGHSWDRKAMGHDNFVDASSIVVRRQSEFWPEPRFSVLPRHRGGRRMEDWELMYRLSRHAKVAYVDSESLRYLVNPESFYSEAHKQRGSLSRR